ncbi:protein-lysine N-methyltransferase EEF2KMT [Aricia agestis]|uniref:protein-lysine N-methyltransferase EEF2KMT n=1 Tax=Aricia agestis TaxID=91739 RepID=UPI001C203231|nr:protein-lysine N-methyltransferase EEF2KMT [Aricia agestis]
MCKGAKQEIALKLAKYFLNGLLIFDLKPEEIENLTWDQQEEFLTLTINSSKFTKYPMNNQFCRLFLKKLINLLQDKQDIHDDIYNYLCTSMTGKNHEYYYCHYVIYKNLENTVIIRETKNMVVDGTTGFRTWEAAFMLCDWALCNKNLFSGKNVLELGSGVGFTGIAMFKYCNIDSMMMTDHHLDVLKTIDHNISINFPNMLQESTQDFIYKEGKKSIGAIMLDWTQADEIPKHLVPDIVIGADIVYDPSILQPLCDVFQVFFKRKPHLEIYIASIIRNEDTFNKFKETLRASSYNFETIPFSENINLNWNSNINGCLLKITKTS